MIRVFIGISVFVVAVLLACFAFSCSTEWWAKGFGCISGFTGFMGMTVTIQALVSEGWI